MENFLMSNLNALYNSNLQNNPISGTFGTGKIQFFIASTTWTVPSGITSVRVRVWGGGAGGANNIANGKGGAGGGFAIGVIAVTPAASITITVGNGGMKGTAGGTSSFGASISATGGSQSNTATSQAGGTGSGGDLNYTGGGIGNSFAGAGAANLFGNGSGTDGRTNPPGASYKYSGSSGAGTDLPNSYYGGISSGGSGFFGTPGGITNPNATINGPVPLDYIGAGPGGGIAYINTATTGATASYTDIGGWGINGGGGASSSTVAGYAGGGGFPGGGGGVNGSGGLFGGKGGEGLVVVEY